MIPANSIPFGFYPNWCRYNAGSPAQALGSMPSSDTSQRANGRISVPSFIWRTTMSHKETIARLEKMPRTGAGWDTKLRHACICALRDALGGADKAETEWFYQFTITALRTEDGRVRGDDRSSGEK